MPIVLHSDAETDLDAEYYVGQKIQKRWYILETAVTAYQAFKARNLILSEDQASGIIRPETDYKVFQKGLNEIQTIKETNFAINKQK